MLNLSAKLGNHVTKKPTQNKWSFKEQLISPL